MKLSAEDAFRQFGDRVFSAAFSATGSKEDADDVVQDTFLKYWDTDQDFTDENHIKAGTGTLYVTVKYGGSFSYSSDGYDQPESFSD